jgi:hypothetical protein
LAESDVRFLHLYHLDPEHFAELQRLLFLRRRSLMYLNLKDLKIILTVLKAVESSLKNLKNWHSCSSPQNRSRAGGTVEKKEALLKFLGSQPSRTKEKCPLPKPEIYLRSIRLFLKISFDKFAVVMFCLSLISEAKMQRIRIQMLDNIWTQMDNDK